MVDEAEYLEYLMAIDALQFGAELNTQEHEGKLADQLRDENFHRVPGCYRISPHNACD